MYKIVVFLTLSESSLILQRECWRNFQRQLPERIETTTIADKLCPTSSPHWSSNFGDTARQTSFEVNSHRMFLKKTSFIHIVILLEEKFE